MPLPFRVNVREEQLIRELVRGIKKLELDLGSLQNLGLTLAFLLPSLSNLTAQPSPMHPVGSRQGALAYAAPFQKG